MKTNQYCKNCKHWQPFPPTDPEKKQPEKGYCHRLPPFPVAISSMIITTHAETSSFDWCGEWKPIRKTKKQTQTDGWVDDIRKTAEKISHK